MQIHLSEQQTAIVEAVSRNDADLQVVARAGCGKTTTILAACGVAKGSVSFLAFNKAIADELAKKAPKGVEVKTLHSLGFAALRQQFPFVRVEADKVYQILKSRLRDEDWDLVGSVRKLVSLCKNNLTDPTDENLVELVDAYALMLNGDADRCFALARLALHESLPVRNAREVVVDYDDMLWLPVALGLRLPQYDWTFVDEAQDMNAAQHELVLKISQSGRMCYVGDPAQAIYAFRGADEKSMDTLKQRLEAKDRKVLVFPLTQTRRCPSSIVEHARQWVSDFEALPDAPLGRIDQAPEASPQPGDMVLCRRNAPLVPIAFRLLRANVPVKIQGKDIGGGLKSLVKRLHAASLDQLLAKLDQHLVKELAKVTQRYKDRPSKQEEATLVLRDRHETLHALAAEQQTVEGLVNAIDRLFSEVQSADSLVLLSTIHKAKGLEAPTVWWLQGKDYGGVQEQNLKYVAATRAKSRLVLVPEPSQEAV